MSGCMTAAIESTRDCPGALKPSLCTCNGRPLQLMSEVVLVDVYMQLVWIQNTSMDGETYLVTIPQLPKASTLSA
jgi:hypothetical protein